MSSVADRVLLLQETLRNDDTFLVGPSDDTDASLRRLAEDPLFWEDVQNLSLEPPEVTLASLFDMLSDGRGHVPRHELEEYNNTLLGCMSRASTFRAILSRFPLVLQRNDFMEATRAVAEALEIAPLSDRREETLQDEHESTGQEHSNSSYYTPRVDIPAVRAKIKEKEMLHKELKQLKIVEQKIVQDYKQSESNTDRTPSFMRATKSSSKTTNGGVGSAPSSANNSFSGNPFAEPPPINTLRPSSLTNLTAKGTKTKTASTLSNSSLSKIDTRDNDGTWSGNSSFSSTSGNMFR